jgi:hypothetical protein
MERQNNSAWAGKLLAFKIGSGKRALRNERCGEVIILGNLLRNLKNQTIKDRPNHWKAKIQGIGYHNFFLQIQFSELLLSIHTSITGRY